MLWSGFRRLLVQRVGAVEPTARRNNNRDVAVDDDDDDESIESLQEDDDDDREDFKEGKEPMSPELLQWVCRWALEWGTSEGIFLSCFCLWSWNLVCRGHNTARIRFSHLSWADKFDCCGVFFKHMKNDQKGEKKQQQRHIFSNPFKPHIDICFVTGLYLATSFQTDQSRGRKLFPGKAKSQAKRASDLLERVLREYEREIKLMGYDGSSDIGLHSLRKGAASYLASLPGGPSPASICLRAGWTQGQIKDIYFRWMSSGDEFVGRCVSLLNMYRRDFGASQVFFGDGVDRDWLLRAVDCAFPCFTKVEGIGKLTRHLLASLVYHRQVVMGWDPNHVARRTIGMFNNPVWFENEEQLNHLRVSYAWESDYVARR